MVVFVDLLVTDNDLVLDSGGEPLPVNDRDCIAQDIKHLIRESGLLVLVVGERDPVRVKVHLQSLELLIEDDVRLVPGTVAITKAATGLFFLTADTADFGPVNFELVL